MTGKTAQAQRLVELLQDGSLSRRQFVKRASALGLSAGALGTILAACGGDDDTAHQRPPPSRSRPHHRQHPSRHLLHLSRRRPRPNRRRRRQKSRLGLVRLNHGESPSTLATATETFRIDLGCGRRRLDRLDRYFAFDDTCTHQGCSLATGSLNGSNVTCPCHGSTFDVTTGEVVNGPATKPVDVYAIEVVGDELEIDVS